MKGNTWEGREDEDTAGQGVTWNKYCMEEKGRGVKKKQRVGQ